MKKIFSSLAILAFLLTMVACDPNANSSHATGSFTETLTYSNNSWSTSEFTLSLSGAKFTEAVKENETKFENIAIYDKSDNIIGTNFTLTASSAADAGATSAQFKISGDPSLKNDYNLNNDDITIVISNASNYFTLDDGKTYSDGTDDDLKVSGKIKMDFKYISLATASFTETLDYDSNGWKTSEFTLSLSGAKFKNAVTQNSTTLTNVSIYDKDNNAIGTDFTLTAADNADAGATSCKFKISGDPSLSYSGDITIVINNASSYFTLDDGKTFSNDGSLEISGNITMSVKFVTASASCYYGGPAGGTKSYNVNITFNGVTELKTELTTSDFTFSPTLKDTNGKELTISSYTVVSKTENGIPLYIRLVLSGQPAKDSRTVTIPASCIKTKSDGYKIPKSLTATFTH